MSWITGKINHHVFAKKWRKKNSNNFTTIGNIFDDTHVTVGRFSYGQINVIDANNSDNKLVIGQFCSIAPNVTFVLNGEHNIKKFSTFPFSTFCLSDHRVNYEDTSDIDKGNIIIDDDVWIGIGAIIMSGVHIHQGAVISAGAVVTKDVPPYSVVGGIPAKLIKYRFSDEIIRKMIRLNYSELNMNRLRENIQLIEAEVDTLEQFNMIEKLFSEEQ